MSYPSKIRGLFLAVFLLGALAGGVATHYYDASTQQFSQFLNKVSDPDAATGRVLKRYAERYQLTSDEINRITPTVKNMTARAYQERCQFGTDMMSILDSSHAEIAQLLDPTHRDAYQKHWEERRKELAATLLIKTNAPPTGP